MEPFVNYRLDILNCTKFKILDLRGIDLIPSIYYILYVYNSSTYSLGDHYTKYYVIRYQDETFPEEYKAVSNSLKTWSA